jgi:hypothetical protein
MVGCTIRIVFEDVPTSTSAGPFASIVTCAGYVFATESGPEKHSVCVEKTSFAPLSPSNKMAVPQMKATGINISNPVQEFTSTIRWKRYSHAGAPPTAWQTQTLHITVEKSSIK